jgi:hypothetical protein
MVTALASSLASQLPQVSRAPLTLWESTQPAGLRCRAEN